VERTWEKGPEEAGFKTWGGVGEGGMEGGFCWKDIKRKTVPESNRGWEKKGKESHREMAGVVDGGNNVASIP